MTPDLSAGDCIRECLSCDHQTWHLRRKYGDSNTHDCYICSRCRQKTMVARMASRKPKALKSRSVRKTAKRKKATE